MNKENIPKTLHFLIPIAKEWGIGDDGYRSEKIDNSSVTELKELTKHFSDNVLRDLNNWLESPNPIEPQTEEYYTFTSLYQAFEYGYIVLKDLKQ